MADGKNFRVHTDSQTAVRQIEHLQDKQSTSK
jgi:hypothetical protein